MATANPLTVQNIELKNNSDGQELSKEEIKMLEHQKKKLLKISPPKSMAPVAATPTEIHYILGYKFLFAYSPVHLGFISFEFGFTNYFLYNHYGSFATMQTGNMVILCGLTNPQTDHVAYWTTYYPYLFCCILGGGFLGPWIDTTCLHRFECRSKAYLFVCFFFFFSCLLYTVLDAQLDFNDLQSIDDDNYKDLDKFGQYLSVLLVIGSCAKAHWVAKLGFLASLQTGNMYKVSMTNKRSQIKRL
jgi:hypothetical protein